jgi:hypothetical protein
MSAGRVVSRSWPLELAGALRSVADQHFRDTGADVNDDSEAEEAILRAGAITLFTRLLPDRELCDKDFPISVDLGFSTSASADVVVLEPWATASADDNDRQVFTLLELKRTYERARNTAAVLRDIARLGILAKKRRLSTYFVLCGRPGNLDRLFADGTVAALLSRDQQHATKTVGVSALSPALTADYKRAVNTAAIVTLQTTLRTADPGEAYRCYVWRIQTDAREPHRDTIEFLVLPPPGSPAAPSIQPPAV